MNTASTNDGTSNDTTGQTTANESVAGSRPKRAPLIIRPWLLFVVSLAGFAANWWAGVYQPAGLNLFGVPCARLAERTGILSDVLLGVYALSGLIIVLALVRTFWRRVSLTSSLFAVIMVPVVIACALLNIWLAYTTQYDYLHLIATCTP